MQWIKGTALAGVVVICALLLSPYFTSDMKSPALDSNELIENKEELTEPEIAQRTNILILGDDSRPDESRAGTRTDTIMLVSLDKEANQMAVLSIPRDSRVKIPGRGYDRINAAHAYGGIDLTVETLEELLAIEIDYYLHTNFDGFKQVIDTLGGVTLDVKHRMYYPAEGINLHKGEQLLDGDKALQFVRFRHYPLGDITRVEQQQRLVKALVSESLQIKNISKLPRLLPQLDSAIDTNFGVSDSLFLMQIARQFESAEIITSTLPGSFQNINGVEYWKVNPDDAKKLVVNLFSGKTSDQVVLTP